MGESTVRIADDVLFRMVFGDRLAAHIKGVSFDPIDRTVHVTVVGPDVPDSAFCIAMIEERARRVWLEPSQ
jgi:hypothetical protein